MEVNKKEHISNIALVRGNCVPKPNQKYRFWPVDDFIGIYVKRSFEDV